MNFFEAKEINKQFVNHKALDSVDISVPEGKIFGLLGPNGAGKTTLIRIINQITAPDSGELFFNGEKLKPGHIEKIGYLPEERGLYKKMKIGEQALYFARLKGMSKTEALKRLKYWFEKFQIQSWWDKKVEELSKGMQQKIQFIITVLHEPPLLIFDEPFSGFDPINTNLFKKEILEICASGATIIFSTHNMDSVEELCDNIALINRSKKILDGPIHQIKNRYKSNIFHVTFQGYFDKLQASLSSQYEMYDIVEHEEKTSVKFRLLNGTTTNQLLTKLLSAGNIIEFHEIIPRMNDIFIRVVDEYEKANPANEISD